MPLPSAYFGVPFFPSIGTTELVIVLVIILIFFGVGRLPEIGKALGESLRSFKAGQNGKEPEKLAQDSKAEDPKKTPDEKA